MQKILLKNLNVTKFKQLLQISSSVKKEKEATINLLIKNNTIQSITDDENGSVYKYWEENLSDICESIVGNLPIELKVSIFKGDEFAKKTLVLFGQLIDLELYYDNYGVRKMQIIKNNKENKVVAQVSIVTANPQQSFEDRPQEMVDIIFGFGQPYVKDKFFISSEDIKNVSKLLAVDTSPEEQKKYITIKANDGNIIATDGGWMLTLGLDAFNLQNEIEISKELWKSLDDFESYEISLSEIDGSEFIFCKARNMNLTTSIVLLKDVDTNIDFNDFDQFNDQGFDV